jgi:hypothetical protein
MNTADNTNHHYSGSPFHHSDYNASRLEVRGCARVGCFWGTSAKLARILAFPGT